MIFPALDPKWQESKQMRIEDRIEKPTNIQAVPGRVAKDAEE